MAVTTLFFDVGGVLLTNGWDRDGRRRVVTSFGLDYEEFRDRHDSLSHDFETGRIDLDQYLRRTVFYRDRSFDHDDFAAAMKNESRPLPGSLEVLDELEGCGVFLATLNNESRELNEHRIAAFGLRRHFRAFISSCYVGFKKPEPEMYQLALAVTQARPDEALFIDDRALNLECAADVGLQGVLFTSPEQLRADLHAAGVLP